MLSPTEEAWCRFIREHRPGDATSRRPAFPAPGFTDAQAAAELARALDPRNASVLRDEAADNAREDGLCC